MPAPSTTDASPLDARFAAAHDVFHRFLGERDADDRLVAFCHFDGDGLAAGALFGRALRRFGFGRVSVVPSGRYESAFSDDARARLDALAPDALVVTDLGVHADGVLPDVPTCYVDHHRPAGEPPGATVISGYAWSPIPCSAWLAYELLAREAEVRGADVGDLLWIGAVGVLSDLGDKAPWPRLAAAKKRHTAKWLKEAVVLTNATRRAPAFEIELPLALLMESDGPRAFGEGEASERMNAHRALVNAEVAEARKAAPVFSATEPFALVRLASACQIHPLIAQSWRGRLPKYAVMAANTGYVEGAVAFSTRTARRDLALPEIYQGVDLGDLGAWARRFGHGHDQASGGHLPPPLFNRLLDALGFGPEAHVVV